MLADLICGLLKPNKGKILLGDEEIFSDLKEWQANIGYISQNIYLTENSIEKIYILDLQIMKLIMKN